MQWHRWGKPKTEAIQATTPPEHEQQWKAEIITDTESISVYGLKENLIERWADHWCSRGALLLQGGKPHRFIPPRRIMEIKFEEDNDC